MVISHSDKGKESMHALSSEEEAFIVIPIDIPTKVQPKRM